MWEGRRRRGEIRGGKMEVTKEKEIGGGAEEREEGREGE